MVSLEVFRCTDCAKTLNTRGKLNQHQKTHTKPFACEKCGKGFGLRADLNRHVIARHRVGNARFPCSIPGCQKVVSRKDNMSRHVERVHPEEFLEQRQKKSDAEKRKDRDMPAVHHFSDLGAPTVFDWWHSARSGHIAALDSLLSMGFGIDSQAGDGNTALHCAAFAGQVTVVEYLLGKGAQLNLKNARHETALFEAAAGAAPEVILTLLKAGSTVTNFGPGYFTPQKCFVDYIVQMDDAHLVKAIIQLDTPQIKTRPVSKAYAFAVAAAKTGQLTILQSILDSDPSACRRQEGRLRPPIYWAVKTGQTVVAKTLLELELGEMNKGSGSISLSSLIHPAARAGCIEVLKTLLERVPESTGLLTSRGGTLLHTAASSGQLDCVHFLLSHTDLIDRMNAKDKDQETALCLAAQHDRLQVVQTLLDHCADQKSSNDPGGYEPVLAAFWNNNLDVVRLILKHRSMDLDAGDDETQGSMLARVARYLFLNDVLAVNSLSYHRDFAVRKSLLYLAAQCSDLEFAELVLTHSEWNLQEQCKGDTWYPRHPRAALDLARRKGHMEMVELLQSHGITDTEKAEYKQQTSSIPSFPAPANQDHSIQTQDDQDSEFDSDLEERIYSYVEEYVSPTQQRSVWLHLMPRDVQGGDPGTQNSLGYSVIY